MTDKPKPEREVAIRVTEPICRTILFNASADAVEEFREFGPVFSTELWHALTVDARFDFAEIVAYLENYG